MKLHIHNYSNGLYCARCQAPKPARQKADVIGWLIAGLLILAIYGACRL